MNTPSENHNYNFKFGCNGVLFFLIIFLIAAFFILKQKKYIKIGKIEPKEIITNSNKDNKPIIINLKDIEYFLC
ncbi:MAG: hypothetical protein LBG80_08320 [Bacteroidales bacterium]|jgi:biopolymer transport protein ExbD|nr:hypothetical protein [Bacteroidales bacterium]